MAKRRVHEFLTSFALPLVAGGELRVGPPVAPQELARWQAELDDATYEATQVDDAREQALRALVAKVPPMVLDGDELAMLAALHNALFLQHPRAEAWQVSDRQRRRVVTAALAMAAAPLTQYPPRILARHALFHQLFQITREDLHVTWWTGSEVYRGHAPPRNVVSFPQLRRVRQTKQVVGYADLLVNPELLPIVAALCRRTPLTLLLNTKPGAPGLHWEDAVFMLREPRLARVISNALFVSTSHEPSALWTAAAAFDQLLERSPAAHDVRAIAAWLVYMAGLVAVDEARHLPPTEPSAWLTQSLGAAAASRPRGVTLFWALPAALLEVAPALSQPPSLAALGALRRWRLHREQARELIGEAAITNLANRLRRHLGESEVARTG